MSYRHLGKSESFQIHAEQKDDNYVGYVYLGVEVVWTLTEPVSLTPAGIEDFAGMTMRKFARRLAAVLEPTTSPAAQPWHLEHLYGASDDWFMPCAICGKHLEVGVEAWVQDNSSGNGEFARCLSHGDPNAER